MEIKKIGIIGQGALGVMYGNYLKKRMGNENVFFIADEGRVNRYRSADMVCNGEACGFSYRSPAEAVTADLIIFAVKFMGMESALEIVKPFVGEQTLFLSVLNGISSEEMIEKAYGADHVLYACVQGMDAGKDGNEVTYKNMGYITIGNKDRSHDEKLKAVTEFFDRTGLAYKVPDDILREQWNKLMLNTGVILGTAVYEGLREGLRVEDTLDIELTEADIDYWLELLATLNPEGHTSMCQDVLAGRPTEVDLFAGTMLKIAKKEGFSLPVNTFLYEKLKELEGAAD